MKKTLAELAKIYGVSERTIRRHCQARGIEIVKGQVEADDVTMTPKPGKPATESAVATDVKPVAEVRPVVVTGNPKPLKPAEKTPVPELQRDSYKAAMTFNSRVNVLFAIAVLMGTDAVSFGWIAWNAFPDFPEIASVLFAGAGMAVGYSAIRNILSYRGWNSDSWLYGFALLQIGVHLCAMEVFSEYSYLAGKVLISALIPIGLSGLSVSIRSELDKK